LGLLLCGSNLLELASQFLQFLIRKFLYVNHLVVCSSERSNDFVQLQVECFGIAVLSVLDQKHHEECDDRGCGIDDQLPSVGITEMRPQRSPYDDRYQGYGKCPFGTH